MSIFKKIAARFPRRIQDELKRLHFEKQIKSGHFSTHEPEYKILHQLINPGDWVVDIGANVGHYTKRLSDLVGSNGRVIAFEPVPSTFALLSANIQLFRHQNVTLVNGAVSDDLGIAGMTMPVFDTGLTNYYEARISDHADYALTVLTIPLDAFVATRRIALVKIDVEGHEAFVLRGMKHIIELSHPILIVETESEEIVRNLTMLGYTTNRLEQSPNILCKWKV